MKRFILYTLFVLFFFAENIFSQTYNFKTYNQDNGLPQIDARTLLQDKQGYLWIGTADGLARFDGHEFKNFTKKNGLFSNNIFSSCLDKKGNIWIGHVDAGISVYNPNNDSFKVFSGLENFPKETILSLFSDSKNNLWIGSKDGLYMYDGKKFTKYSENEGFQEGITFSIAEDAKGRIWVGTARRGVFIYDNNKFTSIELPSTNIRSIIKDKSGNIWIGTRDTGVILISSRSVEEDDFKKNKLINSSDGLAENFVFKLYEDHKGNIWCVHNSAGASKIEFQFNLNQFKIINFSEENGLPVNDVYSILEDRENNMWFGIIDGGISVLYSGAEKFIRFGMKDGIPSGSVKAITQDADGYLWLGTNDGLARVFHSNNRLLSPKIFTTRDGLSHNEISSLTVDDQYNLWVGTKSFASSTGIYQPKFKSYPNRRDMRDMNISSLLFLSNNNSLWIGKARGLEELNLNNFTQKNLLEIIDSNAFIFSLFKDRKNNIWIGTNGNGLLKFDGKKTSLYDINSGLSSNSIFCITEDKNGKIWLGTNGAGVYSYDGKNFSNYNSDNGLSSDLVNCIAIDKNNNIWATTSKGVDKISQDGKIKHYGKEDGFIGEASINASFLDKEGNIWFGTNAGLIKYNPKYDFTNEVEPVTLITTLKIDRVDAPFPPGNKFSYGQNNLTFEFIGISLTNPEKVKYRYKLKGADKMWTEIKAGKDPFASYPTLPPGDYTFMVQACNNDGIWNKKSTDYSFEILPPWWQTKWAYFGGISIIIIGISGFIRYRTSAILKEKKILEEKVKERTIEIAEKNIELEQKNKDITDSIRYAKRLQEAVLPNINQLRSSFSDLMIFYLPKDIVSGDFYWYSQTNGKIIIAVVDCTGHGVPGAFMSVLGNRLLDEIVNEKGIHQPATILSYLDTGVKTALRQHEQDSETRDGMDVSLCYIDLQKNELQFAGAYRPIFILKNGKLDEMKGDKFPVGGEQTEHKKFTNHVIQINKGDIIYMFSDGYSDQFGGPTGKKYMTKKFKKLLEGINTFSMQEQANILKQTFEKWKGNLDQVDDILVTGIRF